MTARVSILLVVLGCAACVQTPTVRTTTPLVTLQGTLVGDPYSDDGLLLNQPWEGEDAVWLVGRALAGREGAVVLQHGVALDEVITGSTDASVQLCATGRAIGTTEVPDVPWTLHTKPTVVDGIVQVSLHAWTEPDTAEDADIDLTATFFYDLDEGVPTPPP